MLSLCPSSSFYLGITILINDSTGLVYYSVVIYIINRF
nr:MAG TPA: hypothetical protein [Caudoviricetes sp.]